MILPYRGRWPNIHETAFVAPSADIVGDVELGAHSSIWFQVVARGDVNSIKIGSRTNIQDHSVLHVTRVAQADASGKGASLVIGDDVTVGHRATLHGCRVGSRVLVGMGAVVMDDAEIGDDCIVGAGALVTRGAKIPPGSLVMGAPAKVARKLTPEELRFLPKSAENYVRDAIEYHGYVPGPRALGRDNRDLEDFDELDELEDMDDMEVAEGDEDPSGDFGESKTNRKKKKDRQGDDG